MKEHKNSHRFQWLPGAQTLAHYQRSWLSRDVIAGIVLSTLLVPQGMAYAELAGLPVITGLYTTILCLIAYAIFGPSRILVLGPDSSLGPIIATTIIIILGASSSPEQTIAMASWIALLVGAFMVIAGVAKLGFVSDLLSKPTQLGYMNGLALTIFVGQLPKLFGFSTDASGLINETLAFFHGVTTGETLGAAMMIGLLCLALILGIGHFMPRIPGVLVAVLVAIAASSIFHLADYGVSLVGTLPKGFPPLTFPHFPAVSDFPLLIAASLGIALVALTDTISTASSFAARAKKDVNGNGEMIGIGAANIAAGFFQGFPVSTSGSRSAVAEQAGAKTQFTGIVGAAVIILMLVFLPGLFRNLPQPTLAAVVIAASLSLADIPATMKLWRQDRTEFAVSIAAFLGVALLGVLQGILVAVVLSIGVVFKRAWWPYHTILGKVAGKPGYHDRLEYPNGERLSGVEMFRFDAPLFFANARTFREKVTQIANCKTKPQWIVIAAEPITDVDTSAADMLGELDEKLNAQGVHLIFAELKDPVRKKLERYQLLGPLNPAHFFPTIDAALEQFSKQTDTHWTKFVQEAK
jgi:high affinity sulfate transporter 1